MHLVESKVEYARTMVSFHLLANKVDSLTCSILRISNRMIS